MKKILGNTGYTIIELLLALFITGIMTSAGYKFYIKMHNQTITQEDISEMQQNSRNSLQEIAKTLRKAGYKVGSHPAYSISGDSLLVFFSETQPIDTVIYYLEDYSDEDLSEVALLPEESRPMKLMKKVNSDSPAMYSGLIQSISFSAVSSSLIQVTLVVQTSRPDEDYDSNGGIRTRACIESVNLRNIAM